MRRAIEVINKQLPGQLTGAEIGVYEGDHAFMILNNLNIKRLYLVDPYLIYPEWTKNDLPTPPEEAKRKARIKCSKFNNEVIWIYKKFEDCFREMYPLDFIYIDGLHTREAVIRDLQISLSLVKKGGIISGHDYNIAPVKDALETLPYLYYVYHETNDTGEGHDWWFVNSVPEVR